MAARPYEFVGPIMKALSSLADTLGTDVLYSERSKYNAVLELVCLHAMTLKIIQDLNPLTVTDAVLQQRLAMAIDTGPAGDRSGWPGWLVLQIHPRDLARFGATEADTVPQLQAKLDAFQAAQASQNSPRRS